MFRFTLILATLFFLSCSAVNKGTTYYIVRHAEKDSATSMTSDVPLSAAGQERAKALSDLLKNKAIKHIYSTNRVRTMSTARPLSEATGQTIKVYDSKNSSFVNNIRGLKGNVLIVGHSNTIDDIINSLMGRTLLQDLSESQYGDLYIVNIRGNRSTYKISRYGK